MSVISYCNSTKFILTLKRNTRIIYLPFAGVVLWWVWIPEIYWFLQWRKKFSFVSGGLGFQIMKKNFYTNNCQDIGNFGNEKNRDRLGEWVVSLQPKMLGFNWLIYDPWVRPWRLSSGEGGESKLIILRSFVKMEILEMGEKMLLYHRS